MSLLTYVVRFSYNTIWKGKIHKTQEFTSLQNLEFFYNENMLKSFLKNNFNIYSQATLKTHDDYDDRSALFAPYDYGIVFVDFLDKKIYSYQNYSGFMSYSVKMIKSELELLLRGQDFTRSNYDDDSKFIIKLYSNGTRGATPHVSNLKKQYNIHYPFWFNLETGIKNNAVFNYKTPSKNFILREQKTFDLLSKTCDIYDELLNPDSSAFYLDFLNIAPKGWTVDMLDNSYISKLYDVLKNKDLFSSEERTIWRNEIERLKEYNRDEE